MSSVGLSEIRRTTSFRLALLFLGLFGTASLILFGFVYWQTAGYLAIAVDDWLAREMAARVPADPAELNRVTVAHATADPSGRRPFVLFDPDGHWIAGNPATLPSPLPAMDRVFDFTLPRGGDPAPFRGIAHRLPSGNIFMVAQDMRDSVEFRDLLLEAMASGGLVVLILGLTGSAIIGAGALGRIDGVTRAIERIVDGDLSERLPSGGTDGDLDRLITVVNRMLDEIERLMHEVKGVTDDIAHDLRTPLTGLLAGLERARRRATSTEEYAAAVDEAIAETKDVLATFSALLRIAEVEDGARRAGFTRIDLTRIAADVAEFHAPVAEESGVRLSLEGADTAGV